MPDIFGLDHPQVRSVADRIAAAGFYVVVPDMFKSDPWTLAKFPPSTPELKAEIGRFFTRINEDAPGMIAAARAHFLGAGLAGKKMGVIGKALAGCCGLVRGPPSCCGCGLLRPCAGFCWGGKWAASLGADADVGAAVTAHPAFIDQGM